MTTIDNDWLRRELAKTPPLTEAQQRRLQQTVLLPVRRAS